MRSRLLRLAPAVALALGLSGCFTLPKDEVTDLSQVGGGSVLIVGAVKLDPPLRPQEKEVEYPNDIFGSSDMVSNRAILGISRSPDTRVERSAVLINPVLGRTFFFEVPKDAPYMVGGFITVDVSMVRGVMSESRIPIPVRLRLDIRPDDRAVYVGTLYLKRDDFNGVVEARMVDDYRTAVADYRTRFGTDRGLRRAEVEALSSVNAAR